MACVAPGASSAAANAKTVTMDPLDLQLATGLEPSPIAPEGASCWICLDEGPDEKGARLMRNCACRGEGSGFAHASCVGEYLFLKYEKDGKISQDQCKNCNQPYKGDMALAVAEDRLERCKERNMLETDETFLLTTLEVARCHDNCGNTVKAIRLVERTLAVVNGNPTLPHSHNIEFMAIKRMGVMYSKQENVEKAKEYLNKTILLGERYGFQNDILFARQMLGILSPCDGHQVTSDDNRLLLQSQIEKYGKTSEVAFRGYYTLATQLRIEGKPAEALSTAKSALKDAQLALGRSHQQTALFQSFISEIECSFESGRDVTLVSDNPSINGRAARVMRPVKNDAEKYIVEFVVGGQKKQFKAGIGQLLLDTGVLVCLHSLAKAEALNGQMGSIFSYKSDVKRYEVYLNESKTVLIRPENLKIYF